MISKAFASSGVRNETGQPPFRLKKILVPIDFSPASKDVFKHALHFEEKFSAELTLLYVLEPAHSPSFAGIPGATSFSETDRSSAEKKLRVLIASTRNGSVGRVRWKMRDGIPSHEIVEMAKEANIDLIIMATPGYTGWKHFCIGSTAERVVRAAPCPVLVVREKEHEFIEEFKKVKVKASIKKKSGSRLPQNIRTAGPKHSCQPVCLYRRSACEFSCGIYDLRALLVEESLERRRG